LSEPVNADTRVTAERRGAVLLVRLDGEATRNALGPTVYEDVRSHIVHAGTEPGVGAVVITGSGPFFSSGGNVSSLLNSAKETLSNASSNTDKLNAMIMSIVECGKPVIAAVEGGAAGAGFALALACDVIIASERANFTASYVRVGLSPDGGMTHFLRTALPRQLVLEICMLGQRVPATRLAAAGLVNRITEEGGALRAALELGGELSEGPSEAIANIKRLINAAPGNDLPTHLEVEARAINLARFGAEAKEGLSAFLERRRPRYHSNG
jgi:enoyl-CoA hydratase/carnithine racemase